MSSAPGAGPRSLRPLAVALGLLWTLVGCGGAPALVDCTSTGAVSVALERDGRLWLGTFAGDRLAWREQQP